MVGMGIDFNVPQIRISQTLCNMEIVKIRIRHTHRKSMWVNALYSYSYLNQQKPLFLPIIAYTLSTTKLEIRAK
jgi:hypothetical protein